VVVILKPVWTPKDTSQNSSISLIDWILATKTVQVEPM